MRVVDMLYLYQHLCSTPEAGAGPRNQQVKAGTFQSPAVAKCERASLPPGAGMSAKGRLCLSLG